MRPDVLERRCEQMRKRQAKQLKEKRTAHILKVHPFRETILRKREEAKAPLTPEKLQAIRREATSFGRMNWYLKAEEKAIKAERRFTVFHGCKTSWPRIERHAIYAVCAETKKAA